MTVSMPYCHPNLKFRHRKQKVIGLHDHNEIETRRPSFRNFLIKVSKPFLSRSKFDSWPSHGNLVSFPNITEASSGLWCLNIVCRFNRVHIFLWGF